MPGVLPLAPFPVGGSSTGSDFVIFKVDASGRLEVIQGVAGGATIPFSVRLSDGAVFYDAAKSTQFPGALVGGRLDTNIGGWFGSTVPTVGQKTMANSIPVTFASDQTALPVTFTTVGARNGVSSGKIALGGGTSGTLQVMRATAYVEPATAAQRSLRSASVNDTAAGTGARTVEITYYDNTGVGPLVETVTLNGTTAVNTVATNIRFIERMQVLTVGSTGANVGVITLFTATAGGGSAIGTIGTGNVLVGAGDRETLWAHHYVATGYKAELAVVISGIISGGSGTNGVFFLRGVKPLMANGSELFIGDQIISIGTFERSFDYHPTVIGFTRVTLYVVPGTNNATATGAFDWSEVPV